MVAAWNPDRISLNIQNFSNGRVFISDSPVSVAFNGQAIEPLAEFTVTKIDGGRPETKYFVECEVDVGSGQVKIFEDFRDPVVLGVAS